MGQLCCCFKKQSESNSSNQDQNDNILATQTGGGSQLLSEAQTETIIMKQTSLQQSEQQFHKINIKDFSLLKTLGRGSFGKVLLVKKRSTQKLYAMKIIKKLELEKKKQEEYAKTERIILQRVDHPFLVKLHYAFQTDQKLYYIMDFCIGGELFFHLRRAYKFKEEIVLFYAAEIVVAVEYLHEEGILYRDLKPENILICKDGHIKLIDFGLSKIVSGRNQTFSVVGTPEYLAPEIYSSKDGYDESSDWWNLGALIYEMLTGAAPFYSQDQTLMFRNRIEKPLDIKPWFSQGVAQLLSGLLNINPKERLSIQQIKEHAFFQNISWQEVKDKRLPPPIIPEVKGEFDLRYFNKMFIEEPAQDSPVISSEQCKEFGGFTFDEDDMQQ